MKVCFMIFEYGSLVKRLRRCPLTAESAVRFRYELLCLIKQPNPKKTLKSTDFEVFLLRIFKLHFCKFKEFRGI